MGQAQDNELREELIRLTQVFRDLRSGQRANWVYRGSGSVRWRNFDNSRPPYGPETAEGGRLADQADEYEDKHRNYSDTREES